MNNRQDKMIELVKDAYSPKKGALIDIVVASRESQLEREYQLEQVKKEFIRASKTIDPQLSLIEAYANLYEAAKWVMNNIHGVSRGGGQLSGEESTEALDTLKRELEESEKILYLY